MGLINRFFKSSKDTPSSFTSEVEIVKVSSSKDTKRDTKDPTIDDEVEIDYEEELFDPERDGDSKKHQPGTTSDEDELPEDLALLPRIVRDTLDFNEEDDPTVPLFTFRYFLLSLIFVAPGSFLGTMNTFRTTSAAYSIFFVQVGAHYLGSWLSRVLPKKEVNLYFFKFNLNPGPWSIKETVMVTITANSGAKSNGGVTPVALAEVFYQDVAHPAAAIFFMLAQNLVGFSFAAIARNFLLYDPQFIFPESLMHANLFTSMNKLLRTNSTQAKVQMKWFFIAILGMTIWEFFPEYIFPMTSSLSFLCWVASKNEVANFIGAGMGGMGFLNISLDWSNITSSPMLSPFYTTVIEFVAFVLACWILLPAAKWGNLATFKHGLMSNSLFQSNGTKYPITKLIIREGKSIYFNETAYEEYGPMYMGAQKAWGIFFTYGSYISAFFWLALFGWKDISYAWNKFKQRYSKDNQVNFTNISQTYSDRLNKINSKYKDVPLWWFLVLFLLSFITLIVIFATDSLFIPWWTCIVGIATGAAVVTPLSYILALTNYQLAIGSVNELIYGAMIQATAKHRHPAGASVYGALAGDAWYRAGNMLQDQKLGHYMHIPQRAVFFTQVIGQCIGIPINYGTMRWILNTKMDFISGKVTDSLHQWTGQYLTGYNTYAAQYVLLGPSRLFASEPFKVIPYGFLFGAVLPFVVYGLHRLFPKVKFNHWNVTIFCSSMGSFYGNLSTGYLSKFILGYFSMFYFFRYRHKIWKKYNYILAAAFDTGYNLAVLLIFIIFSSGKVINMPNWWGNNADSVERCFAL